MVKAWGQLYCLNTELTILSLEKNEYSVGRGASNDVDLPNNHISSLSFKLSFIHNIAFIESFGSNAPIVDGKKIIKTPLGSISEISVNPDYHFVFVAQGNKIQLSKERFYIFESIILGKGTYAQGIKYLISSSSH
jgi:hypothetical protein